MNEDKFLEKIKKEWQSLDDVTTSEVSDYPSTMMLELTNACNLKCIMCQNTSMKRLRGFMKPEVVEKALREGKEMGVKRVALYTTGESLLHPDFLDIAKQCVDAGFDTYVTSNGLTLTEEMCRSLVGIGLESIKISIDGTNKEEYEQIRVRGKFEKLMNNLKMLHSIREEANSGMKIYAGAVITKINEENINNFKNVYGPYVDNIYLSPLVNQSGQMGDAYEELKSDMVSVDTEWKPCKMLWDRVVISYEGKLVACCVDYENSLVYSDFKTTTIKEAWNNAQMRAWRKMHLSGNVSEMPLCKTCNAPYIQQVEILEKANSMEA